MSSELSDFCTTDHDSDVRLKAGFSAPIVDLKQFEITPTQAPRLRGELHRYKLTLFLAVRLQNYFGSEDNEYALSIFTSFSGRWMLVEYEHAVGNDLNLLG